MLSSFRSGDSFKEEFSIRNYFFRFNVIGESKQVFVQSKIKWITPSMISFFRVFVAAYLLFATILSVTCHKEENLWILFMTSWNYLFVVLYFTYGSVLSFYALFCNVDYYRSENTPATCRGTTHKMNNLDGSNCNDTKKKNETDSLSSKGSLSNNSVGGSTCQLMDSNKNRGYSVDSILMGIEENSKRLSVINNKEKSTKHFNLQHARLQNNRLPSVSSDVFVEPFQDLNWLFKIYWFLSCVSLNLTILTVAMYWTALYDQRESMSALMWYLRLDRHGIVLLLVGLDHLIVRTPIRILHFIYPSMVLVCYGIVNGLYCRFTGNAIYSKLNFLEKPYLSIGQIILTTFVVIPFVQLVMYWSIYRLKKKCFG